MKVFFAFSTQFSKVMVTEFEQSQNKKNCDNDLSTTLVKFEERCPYLWVGALFEITMHVGVFHFYPNILHPTLKVPL